MLPECSLSHCWKRAGSRDLVSSSFLCLDLNKDLAGSVAFPTVQQATGTFLTRKGRLEHRSPAASEIHSRPDLHSKYLEPSHLTKQRSGAARDRIRNDPPRDQTSAGGGQHHAITQKGEN